MRTARFAFIVLASLSLLPLAHTATATSVAVPSAGGFVALAATISVGTHDLECLGSDGGPVAATFADGKFVTMSARGVFHEVNVVGNTAVWDALTLLPLGTFCSPPLGIAETLDVQDASVDCASGSFHVLATNALMFVEVQGTGTCA